MPFSRYPSGSCPCQVSLPFELRHFPAGSLSPLSRIEFVSYRLVVLLRLLPTPPHDDAVAVEYGPENVCPVGTFTLLFKCAYERTRSRLRAAIDRRRAGNVTGSRSVGAASARRSQRLEATGWVGQVRSQARFFVLLPARSPTRSRRTGVLPSEEPLDSIGSWCQRIPTSGLRPLQFPCRHTWQSWINRWDQKS